LRCPAPFSQTGSIPLNSELHVHEAPMDKYHEPA